MMLPRNVILYCVWNITKGNNLRRDRVSTLSKRMKHFKIPLVCSYIGHSSEGNQISKEEWFRTPYHYGSPMSIDRSEEGRTISGAADISRQAWGLTG